MNKLKLLYAEDEQQTRKDHIIYIQSRYDFIIYEADDGIEALKLYKQHQPDIVLTDITMPKMCGLELAKEIRKISKQTKIIILTAHSEQDRLMKAFDLSVVNYLVKPISRTKLVDSIDMAIETIAPKNNIYDKNIIFLNENTKFNMLKEEYMIDDKIIKLSKSENQLLSLLCEYKNIEISSSDIFVHIWNDFEKDFSSSSVRTLVKKLRKKLPDGILANIYGGFYKLNIR